MEFSILQMISEISLIDNVNEITDYFVNALKLLWPGTSFSICDKRSETTDYSIEIRTSHNSYGYLVFNSRAFNIDELEILKNAAGVVALILENRFQAEAISKLENRLNVEARGNALEERFTRMAGVSPAVISEYIINSGESPIFLYISPACEDVYGFKSDEIMRSPEILRQRIDPDDRNRLRQAVLNSIRNLSIASYEVRYQHPVKGGIWLQTHSGLAADPDGTIHAYDFTIDVTDYKNALDLLRESEERYRGIFDNASIGIYLATIDEKIINVNPALAHMHGFDSTDDMAAAIPKGRTLAVDPEDGSRFFQMVREEGEFSGFEMEMYKKNTGTFWVSLSARVVKDTNGIPIYFEGTVEDITEKRSSRLALQQRDALFEKLTSCVPGMLYRFDRRADGSYCVPYTNGGVKNIFGCDPEDVRDTFAPILAVILPEEYENLIRSIEHSADSLNPWIEEFRVQIPGNPVRWILGNAIPEKLPDGTVSWFGFHTDITELKHTEEALRASDEQMRNIVENTEEIIHIIDREGIFHFLSPSWEKSTGFKLSETIGASFLPYVHPDDAPACLEVLTNVFKTGKPHKISEFRVKHSSGKWIWFSNSGVALKDATGNTVNFLGVASDITDRKNSENLLVAERDFSRAVIDSLPGLFYLIDTGGRFIRWNKNLRIFTGRSDDDIAKTSIIEFTPESLLTEAQRAIEEVLSEGHAEVEALLRAVDGTTTPFLTNGTLFYNEGYPFIIGIAQDITDRKRLEEQLLQSQKMEAVGQLAGGVAHDFNNLLQAILGYIELVMTGMDQSDKNYARLGQVKRAGERATLLTRQLLAFSRRQVLQLSMIEINDVIAELIQMLNRLIGEHIELIFKPCKYRAVARADRGQIEQVLTNLCVNARDAMPDGGSLIIETSNVYADSAFITGHEWARPGQYICIAVTDTGSGMDRDTMQKIFEPFFTTKEKNRGTGLGLAMVYGIIRQHQGMVQVYSEPGNGSCFRIYLPAENENPDDVHVQAEQAESSGGSETILLAEDDTQIRELACTILEDAGYRVFLARDGQEALDIFNGHRDEIELLFLDVIMPKLSGRAVYDRARLVNPDIKCLFASGYSRDGLHKNYVLEENLNLLQKPYSRNALLNLVRKIIDEK